MFKPVFGRSKKSTDNGSKAANSLGPVISTSYKSHEVDIPDDFLGPLADPSELEIEKIDFEKTTLPEYKDYYAIVIDNLMSREECETLIHMTEMSAGAHQEGVEVENNGWQPAMVNAGVGYEFMATDYRNSDRIIWDHHVLAQRLWERIMQGEGMKEYFSCLDGEKYAPVRGVYKSGTDGQSLVITKQGLNERLRFLKYGAGQFFKEHCDGAYGNDDGTLRSFYTIQLYLNDSAKALGIQSPKTRGQKMAAEEVDPRTEPLRGGATTFHSADLQRRLDVDPKIGRALIFQHRRLLHSGDKVISGIKYTMRSDIMYELKTDQ